MNYADRWKEDFENDPSRVFKGAEDAVRHIKQNLVQSILLDKDLLIREYVLQNHTDDSVFVEYASEMELLRKIGSAQVRIIVVE